MIRVIALPAELQTLLSVSLCDVNAPTHYTSRTFNFYLISSTAFMSAIYMPAYGFSGRLLISFLVKHWATVPSDFF